MPHGKRLPSGDRGDRRLQRRAKFFCALFFKFIGKQILILIIYYQSFMKIKSRTKKAIGILAILMAVGFLRAQQVTPHQIPVGDDKAKVEWVRSNPDAYQALGGQVSGTTVAAPAQMTEAEKTAWLASHPQPQTGNVSSIDQPTVMPWGSHDKAAWIAAHPREWAAMNTDTRIRVSRADFNALPANKRQAMQNDPNYVIVDAPTTATSTSNH